MIITEFDRFCLRHVCAEDCKDHRRYCPMADVVREKTGSYPSPSVCEKYYIKLQGGEKR
jgi:hypothetical protein